MSAANVLAIDAKDLSNGNGALRLYASDATVTQGAGALSVALGAEVYALNAHASETITATGSNYDTFAFASGFGQTAIAVFDSFGADSDALQFQLSMFDPSWFALGATQAQDAIALLSHATGATNTVITDLAGDTLTLLGVSKTALNDNLGVIRFS